MNKSGQTIALCMIVRNEAAVIERCLASVKPSIDSWVICDTGSTDDTQERIIETLEGTPGSLHEHRWRDFGTNRTKLMQAARGTADYLLLLDADMTLCIEQALPELTLDAYLLRHGGDIDYAVPRLVRGDREWRFAGATHEYLDTDGEHTQAVLESLAVEHHGDGSSRGEKFDRDRRLLERQLKRSPDDPRTVFYLAQTYRDLGQDERAIELYLRRAGLGAWDQEVFYSLYQAGVLRGKRDPDGAIALLLDAWESRPSRAEPLHELSRLARLRRAYNAAHLYASQGIELPYPDDTLFVHRSVYEWELLFEWAIAAYWLGDAEGALEANDQLLAEERFPGWIRPYIVENRRYCLERLDAPARARAARRAYPTLSELAPATRLGELVLEVEPAWPQFNPSIAVDGDGFRAIVRTANYRLDSEGGYVMLDGGRDVRTLNYMVELDDALSVRSVEPIDDRTAEPPRLAARVLGYEDCRLIRVGDGWLASATVRDRNERALCEIALLQLDAAAISRVTVLPARHPDRHEKNWMPFVVGEELHFVYTVGPTVVLRCDPSTGRLETVAEHAAPEAAAMLRGGSQGVAVEGGPLFATHEASDDGRRAYVHRFVLLDAAFRVAAISPPFRFTGEDVEFCAGLARSGERLVLTYGIGDRAAGIAVASVDEIAGLLSPPTGSSTTRRVSGLVFAARITSFGQCLFREPRIRCGRDDRSRGMFSRFALIGLGLVALDGGSAAAAGAPSLRSGVSSGESVRPSAGHLIVGKAITLPPALFEAGAVGSGSLITPSQANAVATAMWQRWETALITSDTRALSQLVSPGALLSAEVEECAVASARCVFETAPRPIRGLNMVVPLQPRYPIRFLAEVETTETVNESDGLVGQQPWVELQILTKASSHASWKLSFDSGYDSSSGGRPPYLPFAETPAGPALPGGGQDQYNLPPQRPPPIATSQFLPVYAAYLQSYKDTGHAPAHSLILPDGGANGAGEQLASARQGSVYLGYRRNYQLTADPGAGEWEFAVSGSAQMICGSIRDTETDSPLQGLLYQNPAENNWGPPLPTGNYLRSRPRPSTKRASTSSREVSTRSATTPTPSR